MRNNNNSVTVIVAGAVACVTLLAVVGLVVAVPDDADLAVLLPILLTGAGTMLTSIVTLGRVEQVKGKTDDLSNGLMDAKIRAAVAEVIHPELVDPNPAVAEQLVRDRLRRDGQLPGQPGSPNGGA